MNYISRSGSPTGGGFGAKAPQIFCLSLYIILEKYITKKLLLIVYLCVRESRQIWSSLSQKKKILVVSLLRRKDKV